MPKSMYVFGMCKKLFITKLDTSIYCLLLFMLFHTRSKEVIMMIMIMMMMMIIIIIMIITTTITITIISSTIIIQFL